MQVAQASSWDKRMLLERPEGDSAMLDSFPSVGGYITGVVAYTG